MKRIVRILLVLILAAGASGSVTSESYAQTKKGETKTASGGKRQRPQGGAKASTKNQNSSAKVAAGKQTAKKQTAKKKQQTAKKKQPTAAKPTGSTEEMRRKEAATQKEITETRVKIRENDASIKKNLAELQKLETDIQSTEAQVATIGTQVQALDSKIGELNDGIAKHEKELKTLRERYLKAVKKIRLARANKSNLAFIFSSKNFNQALRRMRYLKQFAKWRDKQSAEISAKVEGLKKEQQQLAQAKQQKDVALGQQIQAKRTLEQQHVKQDAIVVKLRADGEALKKHLAEKQSEANALKNQISALIAAEQAAAAERERKEAEARKKKEAEQKLLAEKREAERKKAEADAKAKAEAEAKAAELAKADKKKDSKNKKKEESKNVAQNQKKQDSKKTTPKKEEKKQTGADKKTGDKSSKEYADARKRKPRGDNASASTSGGESANKTPTTVQKPKTAEGSGFESSKGSLPRPVSGSFKVVSSFGRHALPDLPDVTYDNPGIDAEVSAGSKACAVYPGKVSGVYVLKGFSTVVIVNHGTYYTVYGNLTNPSVKVGDTVKQGDALGKVVSDADDGGRSVVHFEVWRNRDKLNPMDWIR